MTRLKTNLIDYLGKVNVFKLTLLYRNIKWAQNLVLENTLYYFSKLYIHIDICATNIEVFLPFLNKFGNSVNFRNSLDKFVGENNPVFFNDSLRVLHSICVFFPHRVVSGKLLFHTSMLEKNIPKCWNFNYDFISHLILYL